MTTGGLFLLALAAGVALVTLWMRRPATPEAATVNDPAHRVDSPATVPADIGTADSRDARLEARDPAQDEAGENSADSGDTGSGDSGGGDGGSGGD